MLDVGCGTGVLRERLPDQHVGRYTGVDPSDEAIAQADQRAADRTSFVAGDVGTVELAPADVVVLNEMLYYVTDLDQFVDRLAPLVEPGGAIVVSMWRHPGDRALWRQLDRTWTLVDRVEVRNPANPVNGRGWRVACYRP